MKALLRAEYGVGMYVPNILRTLPHSPGGALPIALLPEAYGVWGLLRSTPCVELRHKTKDRAEEGP